jgi:flagellar biosynthesis/type III secretory pathway protein FliH
MMSETIDTIETVDIFDEYNKLKIEIEKMRKDHEMDLNAMRLELDREYHRGYSEGEAEGYTFGYNDGIDSGRAGM